MRFPPGRLQNFFGSDSEEQLSTLFTQIPFWQCSECCFFSPSLFPAGSETIRGAVGRARLHVAFQGGVFAASRNPVLRSPLRLQRASPSPTAPTPANGHVSVNTEDETHAILNVSLSRSHISFHCASGLSHASNSQGPSWAPLAEDFAGRQPPPRATGRWTLDCAGYL